MLWGNVDGAVEPADRPAVEIEAVEHSFVAQRGKELVLLAVQPADGNQSLHTGTPRYPESTTITSS